MTRTLRENPFVRNRRHIFGSWDFFAGLASAAIAIAAVGLSTDVAREGVGLLQTEVAIGLALCGVVLAALAVFATFFDDLYRQVLERASPEHNLSNALMPYWVVAVLGGFAGLAALLASIAWPVMPGWAQTAAFGITTGLTAWSIAGTIQLVGITIEHAHQRSRLLRIREDAASELARRRRA